MLQWECVIRHVRRVPMTGWYPPGPIPVLPDYIGGRCVVMTAADIILIFIGIIGLLISFGSLVIAFLAFFDKKNKK